MSKALRTALALAALGIAGPVAGQADESRQTAGHPVQSAPAVEMTASGVPFLAPSAFTFPGLTGMQFTEAAAEMDAPIVALRPATSRNAALIIVGGAAMIAGAVIGGDAGTIIMVGGAGIGLYGLWRYLQ